MELIRNWFRRTFSDPQLVILIVLLVCFFGALLLLGDMLVPVIAATVIAYLLEAPVKLLERRLPRLLSVSIVFVCFLAVSLFVIVALVPLMIRQGGQLAESVPAVVRSAQQGLLTVSERYPELLAEAQLREIMTGVQSQLSGSLQDVVSVSVASVVGLVTLAVYLILVPLMVFFMLKDKVAILGWAGRFLPSRRELAASVWQEVDQQIGNYIRGKAVEIVVVAIASYITFLILDLDFALLLGILIGLSVLVPYVGATVMTFPVAAVAYVQWGFGEEFTWVVVAYLIVQGLDGNLLVPILFSEAVKLHPVAIIAAILFFGGLWGFWGVFFAIPLATLVRAVIEAWSRSRRSQAPEPPPDGDTVQPSAA
ncbi:MAG: AI-2E family transporter [Deltaproteobacteria bacterium]|nr:AI-2E family transporter [Deltaproteobacteria bacterium]